ncbi:MAG: MraY family glycosyltransferase [bacterium]|nr:MraY family glycosyltransferase [bacterium]
MDATLQFVPVLVVGFAASLGLTPISRQVAMRLGVIDRPKVRNITRKPTPMMGGLAMYVAIAVSLLLFSPSQMFTELGAILSGAAFLAFIGLLDDRYDLDAFLRLGAMTLATCVVMAAGIQVRMFNNPLLDWPITILWTLSILNAINFNDNMDGLCAGLTAIAAAFFLLIGLMEGLTMVTILAAALLGSAVGFLAYNFNPASTFMGDMGSMTLGFMLAVLGIKLEFGHQPVSVTWIVPVLVLALPIFDICLVVVTRLLEGRSPLEAGKDHTSHRIMSLGFNQRGTLFVLYGACMVFGTIALVIAASPPVFAWRISAATVLLLGGLFVLMMWIRRKYQLKQ